MTETRTVFRVKLRLATFDGGAVTWQRLIVDRPSAEEASDLIKWAYRLDTQNALHRPHDQNCSVEKRKIPKGPEPLVPLPQLLAALEDSFALRQA